MRLGPAARARGHRLHVHDTLGSTNAQGLMLAREGETGPVWIVAHRQSAGRGRRGSAWVSPEGNLAASVVWPVSHVAPEAVAGLGFVAGLALGAALDDVAEAGAATRRARADDAASPLFRLKWPNDVLAGGAKLAGILLEAEGRRAVVVGFGVNVARAPEELPYAAASLADLGLRTDAGALFEQLTERFAEAAGIWNKGRGFGEVRRRWLERAAGLGEPVSVRLAGSILRGRHDGIDEGGRLIILAPDGTRHTVTAGEVHFGTAATAA